MVNLELSLEKLKKGFAFQNVHRQIRTNPVLLLQHNKLLNEIGLVDNDTIDKYSKIDKIINYHTVYNIIKINNVGNKEAKKNQVLVYHVCVCYNNIPLVSLINGVCVETYFINGLPLFFERLLFRHLNKNITDEIKKSKYSLDSIADGNYNLPENTVELLPGHLLFGEEIPDNKDEFYLPINSLEIDDDLTNNLLIRDFINRLLLIPEKEITVLIISPIDESENMLVSIQELKIQHKIFKKYIEIFLVMLQVICQVLDL